MALDYGLAEKDFWEMTFAELDRYTESQNRIIKRQEREKASFDYILADLIGRSVARIYNSSNKMPAVAEAYPSLFDGEEMKEKIQEKKDSLSALRFKQFAQSHNKKFTKEVGNKE